MLYHPVKVPSMSSTLSLDFSSAHCDMLISVIFDLICAWIWFNKSILHNFEFSKIPKLAKFSNLQVLFHLARLLDKPEYYEDEGILRRENYLHNSAMLLNRKPANQPWLTFHVKRLRNCWSSKLKVQKNYDIQDSAGRSIGKLADYWRVQSTLKFDGPFSFSGLLASRMCSM